MRETTIYIDINDLLNTCIAETGQVFRGLRATSKGELNAEDWIMTEDENAPVRDLLPKYMADLFQEIRSRCPEYGITDEQVYLSVQSEDCNTGARLQPIVKHYLVGQLLVWWYGFRNMDIANKYKAEVVQDYGNIKTIVIPRFYTRRLRYF